MTDAVYTLEGIRKSYEGRRVVDIEALEVRRGEFLAVVGPSGAGKSTLLRLMNFLEFADEGRLHYAGHSAGPGMALALRRQVTTVFQRPALLHDSVENNVAYGLRLRGKHDGHEAVEGMLERLGLQSLRRAQARTLSGGEAQRVALARAVILRPEVLLLDEQTANLDPYNVGLIEEVLREINQAHGTTLVLVTHNIFQAKRLAQRTALMLNGQIVEVAPTAEFMDSPKDARTRAFVRGDMVY